jgi:ParB family transcriptional regulator, chromosome partitioning protein
MATRGGISKKKSTVKKTDRFSQPTNALDGVGEGIVNPVLFDNISVVKEIAVDQISADSRNRLLTKLNPTDPTRLDKSDPAYHLKKAFLDDLQELADSIKEEGVTQPIRIYPQGEGYRLIFGERRWLASILAGKKTVPAIVVKRQPSNLRMLQTMENLKRKDVLAWERIEAIRDLIKEAEKNGDFKLTQATDLAPLLKIGRTHCYRYFNLLSAPDDVAAAMQRGELTSIRVAAGLAVIKDDEQRRAAIAKALTMEEMNNEPGEQKPKKRKASGRTGPKRTRINLGSTTNTAVIKKIIMDNPTHYANEVDWSDLEQVQAAWKTFLSDIESELKAG